MMDSQYLDNFEHRLREQLLRYCTEKKMLDGQLLESDDITDYWHRVQEKYIADAVMEVTTYPLVSLAWATYLGMAVAYCWDVDWTTYSNTPYEQFYGSEGFDNMDDHIVVDILGLPLKSDEAITLVKAIQNIAQTAVSAIHHERIEPQSPEAYHVFVRACNVMFSIGASIELHQLGYKFEKIQ